MERKFKAGAAQTIICKEDLEQELENLIVWIKHYEEDLTLQEKNCIYDKELCRKEIKKLQKQCEVLKELITFYED